jgi:AcrR family transcriptional regulator
MDVKERIQEKATELFRRYGIKSITMDEIAGQLGISKKTIYQYFADKDELVDAIIDEDLQDSREDCLLCEEKAENAIHENFLVLDNVQSHLRDMNPVILYDLQKFHPAAYQKFVSHKNSFLRQMVENNMRQGIKEELYRPGIRIDILSKFRVDSIYLTFSPDFLMGTNFSLAELQQELFIHFMFGIATQKGHKLITRYLQERWQKPADPVLPSIGKTGS